MSRAPWYSVVPATATAPGTMTIVVTKGNSRGKSLVGQTITVGLLTSTDVIKTGHTTQAALAVGAKVKLDLRLRTDDAAGSVPGSSRARSSRTSRDPRRAGFSLASVQTRYASGGDARPGSRAWRLSRNCAAHDALPPCKKSSISL